MKAENVATSLICGHDKVYLVKLKDPEDHNPEIDGGGLFTILSMKSGDVSFEATFDPLLDQGVEVEFMYPICDVEPLARAVLGDANVDQLLREPNDKDTEGT